MLVQINIDELRKIALLSADAAEKMEQSNSVISTVISKHDWKCPERVSIDETLELIKGNSSVLCNTFESFADKITQLANDLTDDINDQIRDDAEFDDSVATLISKLTCGGVTTTVSGGRNISKVTTALKDASMDESNITSLCGASHGINIMDISVIGSDT